MNTTWRWVLCVMMGLGLAVGAGCEPSTSDDDIVPISLEAIQQRRADPRSGSGVIFVDARNARQFNELHIAGARHMQIDAIPLKSPQLDPTLAGAPLVIVYGDDPGSNAATALTKRFIKAGYENVMMYRGGLSEWVRAGGAVEGTKAPR